MVNHSSICVSKGVVSKNTSHLYFDVWGDIYVKVQPMLCDGHHVWSLSYCDLVVKRQSILYVRGYVQILL